MRHRAHTSRADAHPLLLAVLLDGHLLQVRPPCAACLPVGMAYAVTRLWAFPAYLTFECHVVSLLKNANENNTKSPPKCKRFYLK